MEHAINYIYKKIDIGRQADAVINRQFDRQAVPAALPMLPHQHVC
jgi:hypothetical protein